ncbi:MAG: LacI family transcriptional regulator [Treponema sp.]|jgi:DNA-binding LacI/PurR family transcriptional regulator|nr:LacI family transcriptional regulator [Treponema sp.]
MTIKEVAKKAGVSISTVSRVLNNKNWVDSKTREKVLLAVEETHFVPNGIARYLGGEHNETGIIGALFASPVSSFLTEYDVFYKIVLGITDITDQHGKCLLLEHAKEDYQNSDQLPNMIKRGLVDGIIVGGVPINENLIRDLKKTGRALVVIGKYKSFPTHRVLVDNFGGGYTAAEHLLQEGYKNIALIAGSLDIYHYADKVSGYEAACAAYKRKTNRKYMIEAPGQPEEAGYDSMKRLINSKPKPDAVFITDPSLTIGALRYLEEHEIKVPADIALVSYGCGCNFIKTTFGQLTYIHNGDRNIGHAAARLLFDIIEGNAQDEYDITISTRLIIGSSSIREKRGAKQRPVKH